ncbi:MAG: DNA polymerase III subunit gamma/tau [Anaerovoracaceae bacterium]
MPYKALYRETRPEVFDDLLGQDPIVKILRHQISTGTVSHAYLFCGTRGTGKTTTARLLAKAVNCLEEDPEKRPCGHCENCRAIADGTFMDVIEIDAASNNGVDNIRELRESVKYPPAVGRTKVYIVDEVHMLSSGAYNALLKTLEEPPEHVIFILATTDPEKLPKTVLSRCMRLDFRRVSGRVLADHMRDIAEERGVEITDDALRLIASGADGSVRDSLSILEQCLAGGSSHITRDDVLDLLGGLSTEFYQEMTSCVIAGDVSGALVKLDEALRAGRDVRQMMKDWMTYFRDLLIVKYVDDPEDMLDISAENVGMMKDQAEDISLAKINNAVIVLAKTIEDSRYSSQARILMEMAIVDITVPEAMKMPDAGSFPKGMTPGQNVPQGQLYPSGQNVPPARNASPGQNVPPARNASPGQNVPPRHDETAGQNVSAQMPVSSGHMSEPPAEPAPDGPVPEPIPEPMTGPAPEPDFIPEPMAGPAPDEPIPGPVTEPAPEPEKTGGGSPAGADGENVSDIWQDTVDALQNDPEDHHHYWSMLREGVTPSGIKGDEFGLIVQRRMAGEIVKEHTPKISEKLFEITGKHLNIVLMQPEEKKPDASEDEGIKRLAKEASEFLGTDVRIK